MSNSADFNMEKDGVGRWRVLVPGIGYIGTVTGGNHRYLGEAAGCQLGPFQSASLKN